MNNLLKILRVPKSIGVIKERQCLFANTNLNIVRCLTNATDKSTPEITSFVPVTFTSGQWLWRKKEPLVLPLKLPLEFPEIFEKRIPLGIQTTDDEKKGISEPGLNEDKNRKEAARLIVIRRKKMKKHKLKKLRKRMKFEWAKMRQRREIRKEKEFQASIVAQCKEAESFDAKEYVAEKLRLAAEIPERRFWKDKKLPGFTDIN